MKVLLVEDADAAGGTFASILRDREYEVTACSSAETALEAHRREAHPLVILHPLPPGTNGLEWCRRMRGSPHGDTPVILMVTPSAHADQLQEILDAGADDYLPRPAGIDRIALRLRIAERRVRDRAEKRRAEEERRRLEARLRHMEKLESLGVLAGGAAHDMNNLLAHDMNNLLMIILASAGLSRMELPSGSPTQKRIRRIETAAERAAELTDRLLAYFGRGRPVIRSLDLSEIVRESALLLEAVIPEGVVLTIHTEDNLPMIEGDLSQLRQVVMNLVTNASEAIGEKNGVITVRAGVLEADRLCLCETHPGENLPEGRYAFIEVGDTGCGMDDGVQSKIFDPFFTTKTGGRGLGLAALSEIVRGRRGAIEVRSAPGRGARFRVLFPCTTPSGADPPFPPPTARDR